MRGFLTRIIERRLRRLAIGTAIGMAIVAGVAAEREDGPGPTLTDAELAVEKARLLLGPSLCVSPAAGNTKSCDALVNRAEELLAKARDAVNAAATVVDGGDVEVPRR